MMRLLPQSLAGQTVIVLLFGLAVSHLVSMAIYTSDRDEVLTIAAERQTVHRIAAIAQLLNEVPPEWRGPILHATDSPALGVSITPESRLVTKSEEKPTTLIIREYLKELLGAKGATDVAVRLLDLADESHAMPGQGAPQWTHPRMAQMMAAHGPGPTMMAAVRLQDGNWANFSSVIPRSDCLMSKRAILSLALMLVGVAVLSLWVIRRVTRPLTLFAAASQRLGMDVHAPPLPVTGPSELRQAVGAFNDMQHRIRRMIDTRTQMLGAITHDLRTPITLMRFRAEYVADDDEKQKMLSTLDDMDAMISSVLAFARDDAATEEPRTIDLTALVQAVCDDMADAGQPIAFAEGDRVDFTGRPIALRRAITNLVENGIRYGEKARVSLDRGEDGLLIRIEDDGPGIPEAEIERVFTPFHRIDGSRSRETGGVGLGLSVAQSIVHAHGGEITLANRDEGGLRVEVILPT